MKFPKIKPRPMLKGTPGYSQAYVWIGGTLIVATVIVGGYFAYKNTLNKTAPQPAKIETKTTTEAPPPAPNFNGTYKGNTAVSGVGGLADATVTVTGTALSGNATYKGTVQGMAVSGPVTITGTVSAGGVVSGTISGKGTLQGYSYTVTGTITGQITNNSMICSYSGSGSDVPYSGSITLTK